MYKCSKCGKAVLVVKDHPPVKSCDCKEASIIVDMQADSLKGNGAVKQK